MNEPLIDLSEDDGRKVITVTGELDMSFAPRLHRSLTGDHPHVVIDLRNVSFIDSSGLGVLVNAHRRAQMTGTKVDVVLPVGSARFPFEVTGLTSVFETTSEQPG